MTIRQIIDELGWYGENVEVLVGSREDGNWYSKIEFDYLESNIATSSKGVLFIEGVPLRVAGEAYACAA